MLVKNSPNSTGPNRAGAASRKTKKKIANTKKIALHPQRRIVHSTNGSEITERLRFDEALIECPTLLRSCYRLGWETFYGDVPDVDHQPLPLVAQHPVDEFEDSALRGLASV